MAFPATLSTLPEGIQASIDLIADFDQCFLAGFANLERSHEKTLASWQRIFSGTPLHQPLIEACAALQRNEFVEHHFTVLAATRTALQGSLFDALQQHVRDALGRPRISEVVSCDRANNPANDESAEIPEPLSVWLENIRHWLMEIALVGYTRLDITTLVPFLPALEQIQKEPHLTRQAALLTGFLNELLHSVPIASSNDIPLYRWGDLWSQGMVSALNPIPLPQPQSVSGTLTILGIDLRHHDNLVSLVAYGVFNVDESMQLVRSTFSAYKVDAISGDEIWLLFPDAAPLLNAFAQNKRVQLDDVLLLPTGDLLWNNNGTPANKYKLLQNASEFFQIDAPKQLTPCLIQPADRHPIQLAEPVFLNNYHFEPDSASLSWDEAGTLPIATERLSPLSALGLEIIANSTELFGLLRFNAGRWALQPLAATVNGKPLFTGQTAAKILKKPPKNSTISILQERASRLLRQKS